MWPRSYVVRLVYAIALESNAGFRQKCCVAVCELARSFVRYKLRPGFAPVHQPTGCDEAPTVRAPIARVYALVYAFIR